MDRALRLYKELTDASGAPGDESVVRDVMKQHLQPFVDRLYTDNLGSLIAEKGGDERKEGSPRVMIGAHMDEVGFMITRITKGGFLKFQTLGGWWSQVMLAQRVRIQTRTGEVLGVVGAKPPHVLTAEERKKVVKIEDMYFDIGAKDKEEAEMLGVRPGDFAVPDSPFTLMANPKMMLAKAWDNRIGCAILIELFQKLQNTSHPNTFCGVATVQEEVGTRGAQTSANTVQPDIAFAIDVGLDASTPGMKPDDSLGKIGEGPELLLYDATMIPHHGLRDFVIATAEAEGIPYQFEKVARGGTDAGRFHIQGQGVPSLAISVPTRYMHSHTTIVHRDDVDATVQLLLALLKRLDRPTIDRLLQS